MHPTHAETPDPTSFTVDGAPREQIEEGEASKVSTSKGKSVKYRNRGNPYQSEKTGEYVPGRTVKPRRESDQCCKRGLLCDELGQEHREDILIKYYSLASLSEQRHFHS